MFSLKHRKSLLFSVYRQLLLLLRIPIAWTAAGDLAWAASLCKGELPLFASVLSYCRPSSVAGGDDKQSKPVAATTTHWVVPAELLTFDEEGIFDGN